jgi:hypothetical protein
MASGFDVYVEGLNVDNLSKKAWGEEGEKSLLEEDVGIDDEEPDRENLNGMAFRVLAAVLARILDK